MTQIQEKKPVKNHTSRLAQTMIVLALTAIQSLAQLVYEPYTFTTMAGGGGFISQEQTGTAARFDTRFAK